MKNANYFKPLPYFKGLSSSALKIIAASAMLIDHIGTVFVGREANVWRIIGRLAFPIFAFMIGEGARRTKSPLKYLLRLLIFAFISEIPFDLAFHNKILEFSAQNVFFTLSLGLMSIEVLEVLRKKNAGLLGIFTTLIFAVCAMLLKTDYGAMGVILITALYVFSKKSAAIKLIGSAFFITGLMFSAQALSLSKIFIVPAQKWALAALLPIMLYNGEKGFKLNKYFFYAFYPAHLLILALITKFV